MGHGGNITQEGIVQSMPHGWETLYNPWGMGNLSLRKALYNPCPMSGNNVVQPMGHGIVQPLYGPWVMGPRHIVWPMTHGKKIAEWAPTFTHWVLSEYFLNVPSLVIGGYLGGYFVKILNMCPVGIWVSKLWVNWG